MALSGSCAISIRPVPFGLVTAERVELLGERVDQARVELAFFTQLIDLRLHLGRAELIERAHRVQADLHRAHHAADLRALHRGLDALVELGAAFEQRVEPAATTGDLHRLDALGERVDVRLRRALGAQLVERTTSAARVHAEELLEDAVEGR